MINIRPLSSYKTEYEIDLLEMIIREKKKTNINTIEDKSFFLSLMYGRVKERSQMEGKISWTETTVY
jgi:hypothetical protein